MRNQGPDPSILGPKWVVYFYVNTVFARSAKVVKRSQIIGLRIQRAGGNGPTPTPWTRLKIRSISRAKLPTDATMPFGFRRLAIFPRDGQRVYLRFPRRQRKTHSRRTTRWCSQLSSSMNVSEILRRAIPPQGGFDRINALLVVLHSFFSLQPSRAPSALLLSNDLGAHVRTVRNAFP